MWIRFLKRNLPKHFLNRSETQILMDRVGAFEDKTACELVFHFRRTLGNNPTEANRALFYKFNLDKTTGHRGILITLAIKDRVFSVWADDGVALHTGDKFWTSLCEQLARDLKKETHLQALLNCVDHAEEMLKTLAPLDDKGQTKHFKNELSNAPIVEDE